MIKRIYNSCDSNDLILIGASKDNRRLIAGAIDNCRLALRFTNSRANW